MIKSWQTGEYFLIHNDNVNLLEECDGDTIRWSKSDGGAIYWDRRSPKQL
jgi:hypothetical protein